MHAWGTCEVRILGGDVPLGGHHAAHSGRPWYCAVVVLWWCACGPGRVGAISSHSIGPHVCTCLCFFVYLCASSCSRLSTRCDCVQRVKVAIERDVAEEDTRKASLEDDPTYQ